MSSIYELRVYIVLENQPIIHHGLIQAFLFC